MKPPVETVRITAAQRDAINQIKRATGLEHNNHVCRLALLISLADPTPPPATLPAKTAQEIDWKTFAGEHAAILASLVPKSTSQSGKATQVVSDHLDRGIRLILNSIQNEPCLEAVMHPNIIRHESP